MKKNKIRIISDIKHHKLLIELSLKQANLNFFSEIFYNQAQRLEDELEAWMKQEKLKIKYKRQTKKRKNLKDAAPRAKKEKIAISETLSPQKDN